MALASCQRVRRTFQAGDEMTMYSTGDHYEYGETHDELWPEMVEAMREPWRSAGASTWRR